MYKLPFHLKLKNINAGYFREHIKTFLYFEDLVYVRVVYNACCTYICYCSHLRIYSSTFNKRSLMAFLYMVFGVTLNRLFLSLIIYSIKWRYFILYFPILNYKVCSHLSTI